MLSTKSLDNWENSEYVYELYFENSRNLIVLEYIGKEISFSKDRKRNIYNIVYNNLKSNLLKIIL
tara:strand:+ start:326 stop:520 length:195 start_codon:yes stop_codon:yes gene_type:complete